ncbi:MAG: alanine racemase [Lachnospiraceae bacterium]|nr:alanine racemase [Lachnospiraceae bacterium]
MKKYSRICADIDLSAVEYNFEQMYANLKKGTKMAAVIKADGYGHGAVPIARLMEPKDYIWGFAAATVEEAVSLRNSGIKKPVMLLGYAFAEHYETIARQEIRACVFKEDTARELSEAARKTGKEIKIHFALDTGMTRIGFKPNEESVQAMLRIAALPGIEAEGLFTHFARADETDLSPAYVQLERYNHFVEILKAAGLQIPICHCSNSAGLMRFKEGNLDMVRAGISIYGMYPSDEVERQPVDLKPVMSIKSHIAYIKEVEPGVEISYGGTFKTEHTMTVATIPVGYADGYPRQLSNRGYVLIHGKKAPILGRVCMDQFMVDVTDIPQAKELDEVTLVGKNQGETITVEELGELSGRFNYEFVCDISKRVPRNYYYEGSLIEQRDYFMM